MPVTELVGGAVGSTLTFLGASAMVVWLLRRRSSDRLLLFFGMWCWLYGARLMVSQPFVRASVGGSTLLWSYLVAFATYTINVPGGRFVEAQIGAGWKASVRRIWQILAAYAIAAIVVDLVRGRPGAAMALNNPLVLVSVAIWGTNLWLYRRTLGPLFKTPAIGISATILFLFVVNENLRRPILPAINIEPIGVFVFVICLGYSVVANVFRREAELVAVNRELETARHIQAALLPRALPEIRNVDLAVRYLPMTAVAGDLYDCVGLGPARVGILVADVSGHGIPAALVASMVKVAFTTESAHSSDPAEILAGMNRTLCAHMERTFVTAVFAVIDSARQTLTYANAGHPPVLVSRAGRRVDACQEHGLMLGVFPQAEYVNAQVPLSPGDCALLFTDGVPEARDPKGGFLDMERVIDWVASYRDESARRTADLILEGLERWRGGTTFDDDVTFVVARLT